jgi:hypothetical protein
VDLYIHSPIRLHGILLNLLSTGTTLPFYIGMLFSVAVLCMVLFPGSLLRCSFVASTDVLLGMDSPIVVRQRIGKHVSAAMNVVSKESRLLALPRKSCLELHVSFG